MLTFLNECIGIFRNQFGRHDRSARSRIFVLLQSLIEEPLMSNSGVVLSTPTADTVFVNGKILTVNARDEVTDALAIRGERILSVGTRFDVEQMVGSDTKVVNLNGRTLVPGFIENHIHMTNSPQRLWVD